MRIIMDRDAVCAGDDMNHHREEFVFQMISLSLVYLNFLSLSTFQSSLEITWSGHSIITTMS